MGKKKTTEQFIRDARKVHGDRYEYSKVEYHNSRTKVIIVCHDHGEFPQEAASHLQNIGCPKCAAFGRQRLSTEEFITRARKVHGNKYDYSNVAYVDCRKKVQIICPKKDHGVFEQTPNGHLCGSGCSRCANERTADRLKSDTKEFITKAAKVHGNKYDYSRMEYVSSAGKVIIICFKHGEFPQEAASHLSGAGCPKCGFQNTAERLRSSTEEFITKANKVHGKKYNYSKVEYISGSEKAIIICFEHGEFPQSPSSHAQGVGCPDCAIQINANRKRASTEEFITKAKRVHGMMYDYSNVVYEGSFKKVVIVCSEHGQFPQTPSNHLKGRGCPKCAESRGEKQIAVFFGTHNIKYDKQRQFETCRNEKPLPFDFYLPEIRTLIEFQGEQHFRSIDFFGGEKAFQGLKKRDRIKKNWAKKNGYELIEIRYDEDVEEVLTNRLKLQLPKAA